MQCNVCSNILIWGDTLLNVWATTTKTSKFYTKYHIWKIVRRWHHQLTHLHIHIDCSRNVSLNFTKIQNFISSLFLIQFTSNFHCSVWIFYSFYWSSPLKRQWQNYMHKMITVNADIFAGLIFFHVWQLKNIFECSIVKFELSRCSLIIFVLHNY